ncbi:hypothetical protein Syun_019019 [Stephania yunnanensis]|uniref:Uncharacterized protein n=1 Tax=Stephania yunnanensis TaxID=152371 RepID=A0AAP0NVI9_9MAGN
MVELRVEPYDPDLSLRWEVRRVGKWKIEDERTPIGFKRMKLEIIYGIVYTI